MIAQKRTPGNAAQHEIARTRAARRLYAPGANVVLTKSGALLTITTGGILELQYTDTPAAESTEQPFAAPNEARGYYDTTAEGAASDMVAVMLSIVPGLGHIYKGYRILGMLFMFVGAPMAVGLALLIATGTAGFGFFLLPIYWIAVMVHVWAIPDRVAPTITDEGEQY